MPADRIGWYVHHAGHGHLARFLAVRPHMSSAVTVFSSLARPTALPPETEWISLPRDDDVIALPGALEPESVLDPRLAEPTARGALHWAPLRHPGHRRRLVTIAEHAERLRALVVDVSVEVTALARLLGVPTVVMTQPGDRSDPPHRLAFGLADLLICPWPPGLHGSVTERFPGAAHVHEVGGVSRFADRAAPEPRRGRVLLLGGIGAERDRERIWADLIRSLPQWEWTSAGYLPRSHVDDPWSAIASAEIVVSAAGQNSVADVAAAGRPLVLVPQSRPFDEQHATAERLAADGTAVVLQRWPHTAELSAALDAARARRDPWRAWRPLQGARAAARLVEEIAG